MSAKKQGSLDLIHVKFARDHSDLWTDRLIQVISNASGRLQ